MSEKKKQKPTKGGSLDKIPQRRQLAMGSKHQATNLGSTKKGKK